MRLPKLTEAEKKEEAKLQRERNKAYEAEKKERYLQLEIIKKHLLVVFEFIEIEQLKVK